MGGTVTPAPGQRGSAVSGGRGFCAHLNCSLCVGAEAVQEGAWVLPALSQSSGKPRPTSFASDWGYRHITSTEFLRHLRGELLFVLSSIIKHICIIPFYLIAWSLYLCWLFLFNGIYFFLLLKYINLIFLFYSGFHLVRNAADLSLLQLYQWICPCKHVFSQKGNKGRERISVHLFCPKLGITEECENKTKTLQSHKPSHAWIEFYFAWTRSPIPRGITANSVVSFLQLKILIGNKLLHEMHRSCKM